MKKRKVEIPIYHGFLTIISYTKYKKIQKKYNLDDIKSCDAFVFSIADKRGIEHYYAAFYKKTQAETISHEVCHLVNLIFEDRGLKLDSGNDEAQAYLNGFLFRKIYKTLKRWKKISF